MPLKKRERIVPFPIFLIDRLSIADRFLLLFFNRFSLIVLLFGWNGFDWQINADLLHGMHDLTDLFSTGHL